MRSVFLGCVIFTASGVAEAQSYNRCEIRPLDGNGGCPWNNEKVDGQCLCKDDVDGDLVNRCKTYCDEQSECTGFHVYHKNYDFTNKVLVANKQYCEFWTVNCAANGELFAPKVDTEFARSYQKPIRGNSYNEFPGVCAESSNAAQDMKLLSHRKYGEDMTTCDGTGTNCDDDPCSGKLIFFGVLPSCNSENTKWCNLFGECVPVDYSLRNLNFGRQYNSESACAENSLESRTVTTYCGENTEICPFDKPYRALDTEESCRLYYHQFIEWFEEELHRKTVSKSFRVAEPGEDGTVIKCDIQWNSISSDEYSISVIYNPNNPLGDESACDESDCYCLALTDEQVKEQLAVYENNGGDGDGEGNSAATRSSVLWIAGLISLYFVI